MKAKVISKSGAETGREIDLSDAIFAVEPNEHAVYLSVKAYLAAQRQGTHKSKEKNEVARTTKKAFRQKGTGGARRGSMKSPVVKGGGRAFGPKPHDYFLKVNKKVKDIAKRSALTFKAKDGNLIVVEDLKFEAPKTKEFASVVNGLSLKGTKTVFVFTGADKNTILSARNIPSVSVTEANGLNVYDILNCKKLVLSESAVKALESNFSNN